MDSHFHFPTDAQADHLYEILARRSTALFERLRRISSLSCSDADAIMAALSDELTDNLDFEWEPTDDGRDVSTVLAQFN